MTRQLILLSLSLCICLGYVNGQENTTFQAPTVEDDMTVDPEQNQQWRTGQYKYSAKPKHMWEIGIHGGHQFIAGDVESVGLTGFGVGLHVRKAINYVLSVRVEGTYSRSHGFDARPTSYGTFKTERTFKQGGGAATFGVYDGSVIHRNYETTIISGSIEGVLNIGNILFHQPSNKWNIYGVLGVGVNAPDVTINLFDGNSPYDFESVTAGLDLENSDDRKTARENLKDLLDDDYETDGGVETKIAKLQDDKELIGHVVAGLGVSRKLSKRINLSLEHQVLFSDNDLLDGFEKRSAADESNNLDIPHYTSIRIGINLGSFENRIEPLYWVNPLDAPFSDIAELKQRPKFDLTDSDGDGVIDMIDQEKNTPAGCPVDTRGVILDSDGDGIADCKDKEPYSPPGYDVDSEGVAQVPDVYMTEDEIVDLVNERTANVKTDWFLPMVHFDLDKYFIRPEFYGQLHHVATVMKTHPNLKVVAKGYADNRNPGPYNNVLSYKRANETVDYLVANYDLPRDRFITQYGGEDQPIVEGLPESHNTNRMEEMKHYMNRRVEFHIAGPEDQEMEKPEGPDAGTNTPGSARPGTKYSGNRNSGY